MNVTLFGARLSPFVEKVARALQLKGVPFSLVPPRLPTDFTRWNPQTGKMPVLDVDGTRTFDSTVILRRIDELVPMPPLFDVDPATAARQRFVEDWSDESLYWYAMGLRWSPSNANATADQVLADIGVPGWLYPAMRPILRMQIGSQAKAQGLQRLPLDLLVAELGRRFDELHVWLDDRPFFFADRPSAADLALFGQLRLLQSGPTPQAAELIRQRGWLDAYVRRVDVATAPDAAARSCEAGAAPQAAAM
jgi:glutathione S-transferase